MKKWYWKNGMAFLLAVAMLFSDIVPAVAANDMGETELPTYDAASDVSPGGVSASDASEVKISITKPTTLKWSADKAELTVSKGDVREYTYKAGAAEIPYDVDKDGHYVSLEFAIPEDVSTGNLLNGTVSANDIIAKPATVKEFFGDDAEAGKAKKVVEDVKLVPDADGKGPKLAFAVDWDGDEKKYLATTFVLDFSAVTLKAKEEEEPTVSGDDIEKYVPKYPDGYVQALDYVRNGIPVVTPYTAETYPTKLHYVTEIPQYWVEQSDGKSKGYNKVAVRVYAPDVEEYVADMSKTTVDGKAWNTVASAWSTSFIQEIDLADVFAKTKAEERKVEIKVNWSGVHPVTYVLDFASATKGEDPEYAMPASMKIQGYSKKMAFGTMQQLDIKITKTLPTDIIKVKFVATSGEDKVNAELLKEGIVVPTAKSGSVKIKAVAIKRNGDPITAADAGVTKVVESNTITITLGGIAAPKSVKAKNASDDSVSLVWPADTAYVGNDYVDVEYKIMGNAGTKYKKNDAVELTTVDAKVAKDGYRLTADDLKKAAAPAAGKKYGVAVVKVVTVKDATGKKLASEESSAKSAKVTLSKVQPKELKFKEAGPITIDFTKGTFKNAASFDAAAKAKPTIVYESTDTRVATVKQGTATLKGVGTTTIKAKAILPDGTELKDSYELTVTVDYSKITAAPKKSTITMSVGERQNLTDLYKFTVKVGSKKKAIDLTNADVKFGKVYDALKDNFKIACVSGNDVVDVTGNDVSGNAIVIAKKDTVPAGKKSAAATKFDITKIVAEGKDITVAKLNIKINKLTKPGAPKVVKSGTTGDRLQVSFKASKNASYYIVQLYDKKGKVAAGRQQMVKATKYDTMYASFSVVPGQQYIVKVTAGFVIGDGVADAKSDTVASKAIKTGKLAVTYLYSIQESQYNGRYTAFAESDRTILDVSGNEVGVGVSTGDVSGGDHFKYAEWNVDVPYGEDVAVSAIVDQYVRSTSSDTLTWSISKADKKLVNVKASKSSFDAVLTGKKTTAGKRIVITIKSKNTGAQVATLRVRVVPNVSYGKTVIANIVKSATAK